MHEDYILGRMWISKRNGAMRCEWLAYQPRYVTFKIREGVPTWWAGATVYPPQTMAAFQGYDLSAFTSDPVLCTSKAYDPQSMTSTYEVALPPVTINGTTSRIVQTLNAGDTCIVQTLDPAADRVVQILES